MITRLSKQDLEAIVEQSLTHEPWRVIIAYCELKRRNRSLDPKLTDGLYQLARAQGFNHNGELIEDFFRQLAVPHFGALLDKLSRFSRLSAIQNSASTQATTGAVGLVKDDSVANESTSLQSKSSLNFDNGVQTKNQKPFYKIWWVWLIFLILAGQIIRISNPSASNSQNDNARNTSDCSEYSSERAIRERMSSLGHMVTSIQLVREGNCSYQWLVGGISRNRDSFDCMVITDGSMGSISVSDADCW